MADDLMVQKIKNMIENENLLFDFNIKRVMNEIHLQWN
jgi:hypothetical protein